MVYSPTCTIKINIHVGKYTILILVECWGIYIYAHVCRVLRENPPTKTMPQLEDVSKKDPKKSRVFQFFRCFFFRKDRILKQSDGNLGTLGFQSMFHTYFVQSSPYPP